MSASILITQCLQNDFVKPIGRFDPLPNRLHVGYAEALRLLGENPAEGPVARVMRWAHEQPDDQLRILHVRELFVANGEAVMGLGVRRVQFYRTLESTCRGFVRLLMEITVAERMKEILMQSKEGEI